MKILIIGAGAYGLALATVLNEKNEVIVYSSLQQEIENLKQTYKNERLFPGITLDKKIKFINKMEDSDIVIIALPTNIVRQELQKLKEYIENKTIIITSKGITNKKFVYEIVKETIKSENIYVISGPSFAKDVIKKETITLTLAGKNTEKIKNIFNEKYIKLEETEDIIGTEICGSIKNTFAIGAGILEGMNVSESTKAAYLTKIINDTKKILKQMNGNPETILKSCGIGDILLTCTSKSSRNFTLGYMIGSKRTKQEIEEYLKTTTVEGLNTLLEFKQIENLKIIEIIYNILYNNYNPNKLLEYIVEK